jgi:hypothetical protein
MYTIFETGFNELTVPPMLNDEAQPSQSERLHADLQAHRGQHTAILAETNRAAKLAKTPLAQFLLRDIQDSESKQLELLDQMTASVRDALYWTHTPDALPLGGGGAERAEALESVKALIELERQRARTARRLAKAYAGIDGGLEQALLEASASASEANGQLLQLILRRSSAPRAGAATSSIAARDRDRRDHDRNRLAA